MNYDNIIANWGTSAHRGREKANQEQKTLMATYQTNADTEVRNEAMANDLENFNLAMEQKADMASKFARKKDRNELLKIEKDAQQEFISQLQYFGDDPLTFYRNGGREFIENYRSAILDSDTYKRMAANAPELAKYYKQQGTNALLMSDRDNINYKAYLTGEIDSFRYAGAYQQLNMKELKQDDWYDEWGNRLTWGEAVLNSDQAMVAYENWMIDSGTPAHEVDMQNNYGEVVGWLNGSHSKRYVQGVEAPQSVIRAEEERRAADVSKNYTQTILKQFGLYDSQNPFNDTVAGNRTANQNLEILLDLEPFNWGNIPGKGTHQEDKVYARRALRNQEDIIFKILFPDMEYDSESRKNKVSAKDIRTLMSRNPDKYKIFIEEGDNWKNTFYAKHGNWGLEWLIGKPGFSNDTWSLYDSKMSIDGVHQVFKVVQDGEEKLLNYEQALELKKANNPNVTITPTMAVRLHDQDLDPLYLSKLGIWDDPDNTYYIELDLTDSRLGQQFHKQFNDKNADMQNQYHLKTPQEVAPNDYTWRVNQYTGRGEKFDFTPNNTLSAVNTLYDDANNAIANYGSLTGSNPTFSHIGGQLLLAHALTDAEEGNPQLILQELPKSANRTYLDDMNDFEAQGGQRKDFKIPAGKTLGDKTEGAIMLSEMLDAVQEGDYARYFNTLRKYDVPEDKIHAIQQGFEAVRSAVNYYQKNFRKDLDYISFTGDESDPYYENPGGIQDLSDDELNRLFENIKNKQGK